MDRQGWYLDDEGFRGTLGRHAGAEAVRRDHEALSEFGWVCQVDVPPLAEEADRHPPELRRYAPDGTRVDRVVYHPAWEAMGRIAYEGGIVWRAYQRGLPGARTTAMGLGYLFAQAECGVFCPVCMTDGAARLVQRFGDEPQVRRLLPRLTARRHVDLLEGAMFLTEKAGGSDVGTNETVARPDGGRWRLFGEKWFCSNVTAEVAMVLARPEGAPAGTRGLGLFVLRRTLPDGRRNALRIERLKDKLGTRGLATGEVVLDGAEAELLGRPDRGFLQMTDMLNLSRLYNAVASCGLMRRAIREATSHAAARAAFGRPIQDHPLLRETLAWMLVEGLAADELVFRTVALLDAADAGRGDADTLRKLRVLTPLVKLHTGRLAVRMASEAMEVLGGNGYVEDFVTCRLLRDAQVLPIWEGTTNVLALDALRAMGREAAHEPLIEECRERARRAAEARPALSEAAGRVLAAADAVAEAAAGIEEPRALWWCERAVRLVQAALLASAAAGDPALDAALGWHLDRALDPAPALEPPRGSPSEEAAWQGISALAPARSAAVGVA